MIKLIFQKRELPYDAFIFIKIDIQRSATSCIKKIRARRGPCDIRIHANGENIIAKESLNINFQIMIEIF